MVKQAIKMKKKAFQVWLAWRISDSANSCHEARRSAASVVTEEGREAMEENCFCSLQRGSGKQSDQSIMGAMA